MISRLQVHKYEGERISNTSIFSLDGKRICKMRVCRLNKHDDAVFFVQEIGQVVDLTFIALHLKLSLPTYFSKSAGNEEFKPQIIEMRAFL